MKNKLNKITNGEGAKLSLLLILIALSSIGFGCNGSFSTGNSNSETTNKVEDNRMTNNNSVGEVEISNSSLNTEVSNSNSNVEVSNSNSNVETANTSTEKPEEIVPVPSEAELQALTKTTLTDFNAAVQKKDFTDFQAKVSDVWKKTVTVEAFNNGFKQFMDKKIDISNIKDETATFDPAPSIVKKNDLNVLLVKGRYNTSPLPVRFDNEYIKEGDVWKLISIRVDTRK